MKTYKIDVAHSEITFKVRHLLISNVSGNFTNFDASLEKPGADFSDARVSFSAQTNSVNTNNEQRDAHLRGSDFFDSEIHPELKFTSTGVEKLDDDEYKFAGDLTIKGVTAPVTILAAFNGEAVDGYGQTKIGFEGNAKIYRKDFGLVWGMVSETGQVLVGDEVKMHFEIQFIAQ